MTDPLHDDALVAYYKKQYGVEDKPAPTTAERLKAMIQAKSEDPQYGRLTTAKAAELKRNSLKWTHRSRQFFSEFKLRRLLPLQLVGAAP
ncbi:hypothetical protein V2V48_30490 [Pseudomonas aeruginosa]|uniref:hypothetical protein n=1 Tax=Pseudomonas aeruginosa TaxID=287 RepID=UPI0031372CB9